MAEQDSIVGPILFLDEIRDGQMHLAALFIAPDGTQCPPITPAGGSAAAPFVLSDYGDTKVLRARFALPCDRPASYEWSGEAFDLAGVPDSDLRLAYVSCNGEETGDLERPDSERNVMWARLRRDHERSPFALLLHGGDQVYADEATQGHPLSEDWPDHVPQDTAPEDVADLRRHLRAKFLERYATLYHAPDFAWLSARVPSLMQWDDHDICDGWGSLSETTLRSPVGQSLFDVARESFLTFQNATRDGDLPKRFADPNGVTLGWSVQAPGLCLLAPDLRSERNLHAVMGPVGWSMMEEAARTTVRGKTFLMSSVPLLGPRLSLLERVMIAIPKMQEYEDDLRDQWQSRAHREEWKRMLTLVRGMASAADRSVTAISGEIHLATRAVMDLGGGDLLHQLVASGITHRPPPRAWARFLGLLAQLGEDPLPECPIRVARIPGQAGRYVAERNYLVLERQGGAWQAIWELEESGASPPLPLD